MSRVTRDGSAEPVSRDQIFRHERGQGSIHFSSSADHEQDWQPYPVDPYSCYMCGWTYIHAINTKRGLAASQRSLGTTCEHRQIALIGVHPFHLKILLWEGPQPLVFCFWSASGASITTLCAYHLQSFSVIYRKQALERFRV